MVALVPEPLVPEDKDPDRSFCLCLLFNLLNLSNVVNLWLFYLLFVCLPHVLESILLSYLDIVLLPGFLPHFRKVPVHRKRENI